MNKTTYWLPVVIISFLTLSGCLESEDVRPALLAEEMQTTLHGRWNIERIESELCRDRNCTSENYEGKPTDYFEFRADSAFLMRLDYYNKTYRSAYKVNYHYNPGTIVLSSGAWVGYFEIKEAKDKKLVLKNSFTGQDPKAVFTDSYYLYR
ncbi:hypothetical protein [Pontibacter beigongshangensis]|uniref:hypothetical protein n=1 Tax=Pontibacter beigongshangensis TaxID=2574733 RepID=UPI00164EE0F3|nr:hypothetical protein [Pontibacter beigongshangensis]